MSADDARAAAGAEAIAELDAVTRRLRRECPWDRAQDERSIVPHTVEEAYELADAAAAGDDAKLLDELGDVLFQVHFLALLLEERDAGDLAAVAAHTTAKLIRRHPHVFGEVEVEHASEVLRNWDAIKQLLQSQNQQKALDDFVKDFQKRWKDKTDCRSGFVTQDCKNAPKPKATNTVAPGSTQQNAPPANSGTTTQGG